MDFATAKAQALRITEELQRRDEALRDLLSYCRSESETAPYDAMRVSYTDVATKLAAILDGEN